MPLPAPMLIDLAALRNPPVGPLTAGQVTSALEHRMGGLLYSWAASNDRLTDPEVTPLLVAETANWARNEMLAAAAVDLEAHASAHGVEICFFKGVALESQVYDRRGERPSTDLDVIVRGGSVDRIAAWVVALQPRHRWVPVLESLITEGHIQAIDLVVAGVQVDVHFDPLKLEIVASRARDSLLSRTVRCDLGPGLVTGLDPESSLVLALLHLNKDRFRRLSGFADVARLMRQVRDWEWVLHYADREGLRTPVVSSLGVVARTLEIDAPHLPNQGFAGMLWRVVWPSRIQLLGQEGVVRFRYRQMFIAMFTPNRLGESIRGLLRRILPPIAMLRAFHPDVNGPYLWLLFVGRLRRRIERARRRDAARREPKTRPPPQRWNRPGGSG